jgi:hypothetical protein
LTKYLVADLGKNCYFLAAFLTEAFLTGAFFATFLVDFFIV